MKHSNAYRTLFALAISATLLVGCKKSESGASGTETPAVIAFNAYCPIQSDERVSSKAPTVEYKGHVIGFCCKDCVEEWNDWTEAKKDAFVAAQAGANKVESEINPDEMPPGH